MAYLLKLLTVTAIFSQINCYVLQSSDSANSDRRNDNEYIFNPIDKLRVFMKRHTNTDIPDRKSNSTSTVMQNATEAIIRNSLDIEKLHLNGKNISSDVEEERNSVPHIPSEVKRYKVKPAIVITRPPPTIPSGPRTHCVHTFYKVQSAQTIDINQYDGDDYDNITEQPSIPVERLLPDGQIGLVEECAYGVSSCFSIWTMDAANNTVVLGQGCWKTSLRSNDDCLEERCLGKRSASDSYFCCCRSDYCNYAMEKGPPAVVEKISVQESKWDTTLVSVVAAITVILLACLLFVSVKCAAKNRRRGIEDEDDKNISTEDEASTGLCVDNLTLIEHIGTGKFGSVWRGSLGPKPVAVKIYKAKNHMQHEVDIYTLPHMAHDHLLHLFGSESARVATGRHVAVLQLCSSSLQARLAAEKVTWGQFVQMGQGIASGLAHLHTPLNHNGQTKPCVVHRDLSSKNVLLDTNGNTKLADLGLAMPLYANTPLTSGVSEAGTWRYLSPEALEGAVDLCAPRAALTAVDVYALGLLLWEILNRVYGDYEPPFAQVTDQQTLVNLVSRQKVRPVLPRGNSPSLRLTRDTCADCWDHDADARLTAVCVVERFSELKQLLQPVAPLVRDDNLRGGSATEGAISPETDKNSNCAHDYEPTTQLYTQPHIGRNACIQRNTNDHIQNCEELIEKSLKDTPANMETVKPNYEENCISVARGGRKNVYAPVDIIDRAYHRPIDYVPNDVSTKIKDTNIIHDKAKKNWITDLFKKKNNDVCVDVRPANLNLNGDVFNYENPCTLSPPNRTLSPTMMGAMRDECNSKHIYAVIVPKGNYEAKDSVSSLNKTGSSENVVNCFTNSSAESSLENVELKYMRNKSEYSFEHSDCSSASDEEHLMLLSENGRSKIILHQNANELNSARNGYMTFNGSNVAEKENLLHTDNPLYYATINGEIDGEAFGKKQRQRSLEQVSEIFTSSGCEGKLQNPANRVKTPGDVPASVRQARRDKVIHRQSLDSNRLSLYDDSVMLGNDL